MLQGLENGRAGTWLAEQHAFCVTSRTAWGRGWGGQLVLIQRPAGPREWEAKHGAALPGPCNQSEHGGHSSLSSEGQGERSEAVEGEPWGIEMGDTG